MSTFSRALRHIDIKDVKKKHQQKLIEEKRQKRLEREEKRYIKSVMKKKKYDWRKELNEGMTSYDVFFTTLPSTGDTVLQAVPTDSVGTFSGSMSVYNSGINFGSTGFNVGSNYVQFSGQPNAYNDRYADTFQVDTSQYTTVTISSIAGNNTNGGTTPVSNLAVYWFSPTNGGLLGYIPSSGGSLTQYSFTLPNEARGKEIDIFFVEPDVPQQYTQYIGKSLPSIHPSTWNSAIAADVSSLLNLSNPTTSDYDYYGGFIWIFMQQQYYGPASAYTWNLPGYPAPVSGSTSGTTQADRIAVGQAIYNAYGYGGNRYPLTYGISEVSFQRKTPVNVFLPLSSPEATSFIRTDPMLSKLSPQERLQKLKEMLSASDEYLEKMLGKDFPGTGAVPPGEYEVPQPPTWEQAAAQAEIKQVTSNVQSSIDELEKAFNDLKQAANTPKPVTPKTSERKEPFYVKGEDMTKQYNELKSSYPNATDEDIGMVLDIDRMLEWYYTYPKFLSPDDVQKQISRYTKSRQEFISRMGPSTGQPSQPPTPKLTTQQIKNIDKQIEDLKAKAKQSAIDARNNELAAWGVGAAAVAAATVAIGGLLASTATASAGGGVAAALRGLKTAADAAKAAASRSAASMGQNSRGTGMGDRWSPNVYNSYEPQGQIIIEKKLKSPQEILNKIPGYYDGKPAPLGFPETPPPKMVNGMHPDLVDGKKVADRFNRLDPESAKAMPLTGNPHIDKKVKAARKKPK